MTTRYYRPAIKTNNGTGSTYFVPVPIMSFVQDPALRGEIMRIPLVAGGLALWQTADPRRVEMRGRIWGAAWDSGTSRYLLDGSQASMSNALDILAAFEAALQGQFWLYRWNTEHLEDCMLAPETGLRSEQTDRWHVPAIEWTASVVALDPEWKTTSPIIGAGYWESFVGGGQAEEATATIMEDYQVMNFSFPGLAVADTASTQIKAALPGPAGATVSVVAVQIVGCSGAGLGSATGSTTVTASLSSLGAGIDATVESDELSSAAAAGTLSGTAGDTLYVHRSIGSGGGGHTDIAVQVLCKRA